MLPTTAYELVACDWSQLAPYYQELEQRPLTPGNVDVWLSDWARLGKLFDETYWRLWVDTTLDTQNADYEQRFNHFLEHLQTPMKAAEQRLKHKLLASGLQPANFVLPLRNMQAEADLFREVNLPLLNQEQGLSAEYDRIKSLQTVAWQGEERTVAQLYPLQLDPDRAIREKAWRLTAERQAQDRGAINHLWRRFMDTRVQLAANSNRANYRAYRWQQLLRLDYTPADCLRFHKAIEQVVVPAAKRIYERKQRQLGVDRLRPWDVEADPSGQPALKPFTNAAELQSNAAQVFQQIDPQLGVYFQRMQAGNMLDLENRKGKMPSAYCAGFFVKREPFVFMNVVGTHEDLMTLLHECGHAFHVFECAHWPYHQQLEIGTEFHEVASTTLELLGAPYLAEAGFYAEADLARARVQHLETMLCFWPYMAVVDAFQHWAYTTHTTDPAACDDQWRSLWERFMPGVDWSGLEDYLADGWRMKLHIHQVPFYYIDYGLAQLGAVQIWQRAQTDRAQAVADYRHALSLGGTVALPALYAAAGAKLAFDAATLADAVAFMESEIYSLSDSMS
ncbi:MAG: M3 family oligoendopeptidase [Anaerolineae bacterium]|nr:M3 family oligoendopeptidase [Anaerolineae bacterium]